VSDAGGAKSTTAKLIETMPTPADQCAPAPAGRLHARGMEDWCHCARHGALQRCNNM